MLTTLDHVRPLRVLVCGSRDWPDSAMIAKRMRAIPAGSTIINGYARGADRMADRRAILLGLRVERFYPDWKAEPRKAGILRNLAMLDTNPDLVLAFQRGGSRGTQHTIDEARKRGIPVEVFTG